MKQTIDINIYESDIELHQLKDGKFNSYYEKRFEGNPDDYDAFVFKCEHTPHVRIIAVFRYGISIGTVSHEVIHIKNQIFSSIGHELCLIEDEPEAYLVGFITNRVLKYLKIKKTS